MNNLNVFMMVSEKMNITEAAKALFISQPAVSKAVKSLEESLHVKLFLRDKHQGLILTDVGKEILILARQMKSIENKIHQAASRESQMLTGKVRIGSFPAASTVLLPKTIAKFRVQYPHVTIELIEGVSSQIKEWVRDRTIEIGLVSSPFEDFEYESLLSDHMVVILPEHHALRDEETIHFREYHHEFIYCTGGHEAAISNVLQTYNLSLQANLTVQSTETLIHMVNNNLGIGLVSEFSLSSVDHHLIVKNIEPQMTRNIGVIALSFEEISMASTAFIRFLREQ